MAVERTLTDNPRLLVVAAELRQMIAARYPAATFELTRGDDPAGLYLIPTVDVADTEDVAEIISERMLQAQIDEGLPVYVFPVRPLARVLAERGASAGG